MPQMPAMDAMGDFKQHDAYASGRKEVPQKTPEQEAQELEQAMRTQIQMAMKYSEPLPNFVPADDHEKELMGQFENFCLKWTVGSAFAGASTMAFITHVWLPRSFLYDVWADVPRAPKFLAIGGSFITFGSLGLQYSFSTGVNRLASMPESNISRYFQDVAQRWRLKSNPPTAAPVTMVKQEED